MALATLSIDLEARLAKLQEGMSQAERIAAKTAAGIEAKWGKLSNLGVGLGSGLVGEFSIRAVTAFARATVGAVDALNDAKDATGATVETLSGLEDVARRNGGTLDDVTSILVKFNSQLNEADGKNGASQVLKKLGLDAEALKRIDPGLALQKVAVALQGVAEDGDKARAVQQLFGKSIKDAGPFLKDLAEQGRLNSTVTTQQAEEAERFNKELFALQTNAGNFARALTGEVIPSLNALFSGFRSGGLKGAFDEFGETVGLGKAYYEFRNNVKPLQTEVAGLQSTIETLKTTIKADPTNPALPAILEQRSRELEDAQKKLNEARTKFLKLSDGSAGGGRGFVNPAAVKPSIGSIGSDGADKAPKREPADFLGRTQDATAKLIDEWSQRNQEALDKLDAKIAEGYDDPVNGEVQRRLEDWRVRNEEALDALDDKAAKTINDFAAKGQERIQQTLGDGLYDALSGNFDNIGKSFGNLIKRMIAESLAADIMGKIFGTTAGGSSGNILATVVGFFAGGRASGGPTSPGKMYEVNEQGTPELLEYGGREFLLSGKRSGYVRPLTAGGAAGGVVMASNDTYNIGQGVSAGQVAASIRAANAELEARMRRMMRAGVFT